jgi:hypothetical protein
VKTDIDLPLPKPVLTAIAAFAVVVLAIALIYSIVTVEQHHSVDSDLRAGAARALPSLTIAGKGYESETTFYRLYQRFVYDERHALVTKTVKTFRKGQFAQVLIVDTRSSPPQSVLLNAPPHAAIPLDTAATSSILQGGKSAFTTTHVAGTSYRAYLVPIPPPLIFAEQDVIAVLEVLQKN